jgi:hypothetical protein
VYCHCNYADFLSIYSKLSNNYEAQKFCIITGRQNYVDTLAMDKDRGEREGGHTGRQREDKKGEAHKETAGKT